MWDKEVTRERLLELFPDEEPDEDDRLWLPVRCSTEEDGDGITLHPHGIVKIADDHKTYWFEVKNVRARATIQALIHTINSFSTGLIGGKDDET